MSYKPIGGVERVVLKVASLDEATNSSTQGVELTLIEDGSTYTKSYEWMGAAPLVKHQLTVKSTLECDITLIDELKDGLYQGFNATIYLSCGECVELPNSAFSTLYLVSGSVDYGASPTQRPSRLWYFESNSNE
ncbi:MAG: hypothetical protein SNJ33_06260 [Rikenellaceae bacterium]